MQAAHVSSKIVRTATFCQAQEVLEFKEICCGIYRKPGWKYRFSPICQFLRTLPIQTSVLQVLSAHRVFFSECYLQDTQWHQIDTWQSHRQKILASKGFLVHSGDQSSTGKNRQMTGSYVGVQHTICTCGFNKRMLHMNTIFSKKYVYCAILVQYVIWKERWKWGEIYWLWPYFLLSCNKDKEGYYMTRGGGGGVIT